MTGPPATIPTVDETRTIPSDPERCAIRVNGRTVARLRAIDVETLGIRAGTAWTDDLASAAADAAAGDETRRAALRLLARRAYSRHELTTRLAERPFADTIVDELADAGWLDDAAYATDLARSLIDRQPAGRELVLRRLAARGIDPHTATAAADAALAGVDSHDAALALARTRALDGTADPKTLRRIAGLLARRGFDADAIEFAIDAIARKQSTVDP